MTIWEEMQPWIDEKTGLCKAGDFGTDNLVLMTTYLYRELKRDVNCSGKASALLSRAWQFLGECRVDIGLFKRNPGDNDDNSVDNLIGTCFIDGLRANEIRHRWNSHFSCFNINEPYKIALDKNFYGRFIGLKAYIVACAWLKPSIIQRLLWCLAVVWSVHTSRGASDPLLMSLQVDMMEKYCPKTARYWKRHYSPKVLYSDFFGKDHPMTKYAANTF